MKRLSEIIWMREINETELEKVNELSESIKSNGWVGCPILVTSDSLITGSHRLAALKLLYENDEIDLDIEVAENVDDLIEEAFANFEEENGYVPDLSFDDLGWLFEGTWIEQYKDEIKEW